MDPTTTLFTFMLQTHPSVSSVRLLGSWDNFSKYHPMERDARRARSQWRGCHTFNNIICDGDQITSQKRSGGLKMGQTYYYYYELDGSTETYDPSMPTTNACPYLPGQTVNTLDVPSERLSRIRSASMNSLRIADYRTMEPKDKFMTPRPAPPVPSLPDLRVGSSPQPAMSLVHKRSARSLSPAPSWTSTARRFLGRKKGCSRDSDAGSDETEVESHHGEESRQCRRHDETRSTTPSGRSIRSRDMSPESLRRFLSDDRPQSPSMVEQAPRLLIPDEIVEENEDDDNFATSAVSENAPFTVLSPSPFQRSVSSSSVSPSTNESTTIVVPLGTKNDDGAAPKPIGALPRMDTVGLDVPRSHFSYSTTSSSLVSPVSAPSPESRDLNQYSFFDDSDNESEDAFPTEDESFVAKGARRSSEGTCTIPKHLNSPITGYSLPQPATQNEKLDASRIPPAALGSPDLVTRLDSGVSLGSPGLLGRPGIDAGLDDLVVSDMGWMANFI